MIRIIRRICLLGIYICLTSKGIYSFESLVSANILKKLKEVE